MVSSVLSIDCILKLCKSNYIATICIICLVTIASVTTEPVLAKFMSIEQIEVEFAMMTQEIKEALIRNNVNVVSLIEKLCTISAVTNKKIPLFDKDMSENVTSIDEFWNKLKCFWKNIFDYDLLWYVIKVSKCREAEEIFERFLSRIDPSAIEDVDLVPHCRVEHWEGSLKPVLRIKVNAEKCTVKIKKMVEEVVSKTYQLDKYALHFQGIKEGCIELLYCISQPLKLYLLYFEISVSILAEFLTNHIISLHIDEFELKIPSKISDITVSHRSS